MNKLFSHHNQHFFTTPKGEGWQEAKHQVFIYGDRRYSIETFRKTDYSLFQKILRGTLGVLLSVSTLGLGFVAKIINRKENALSNKIHELFTSSKFEFVVQAVQPSIADGMKSTSAGFHSTEEVVNWLEQACRHYDNKAKTASDRNHKTNYKNKAAMMRLAIDKVQDASLDPKKVNIFELEDVARYENKTWKTESLRSGSCQFQCTREGFRYNYPGRDERAITQDPAHKYLGGAALDLGCVVEELQALEMPFFTALLMKNNTLKTRARGTGPGKGYPTPLIIEGLYRHFDTNALYYPKIYNRHMSVKVQRAAGPDDVKILDQPHPSPLICSAAPDLRNYSGGPFTIEVVEDLFNTCLANFDLVKKYQQAKGAEAPTIVDAVKLGGGAFKNDEKVIYCVQRLAAQHAEVSHVLLHKMDDIAGAKTLFNTIQGQMAPNAKIQDWLNAISVECKRVADQSAKTQPDSKKKS